MISNRPSGDATRLVQHHLRQAAVKVAAPKWLMLRKGLFVRRTNDGYRAVDQTAGGSLRPFEELKSQRQS